MKTTVQMLGAPFGAFYVIPSRRDYPYFRSLAASLGRGELCIVSACAFLEGEKHRGGHPFVIDHAVWEIGDPAEAVGLKRLCRVPELPTVCDRRISSVLAMLVAGFISELDEKGETMSSETAQLALTFLNDDENKGTVAYHNETLKAERVRGYIDGGGIDIKHYLTTLNRE